MVVFKKYHDYFVQVVQINELVVMKAWNDLWITVSDCGEVLCIVERHDCEVFSKVWWAEQAKFLLVILIFLSFLSCH